MHQSKGIAVDFLTRGKGRFGLRMPTSVEPLSLWRHPVSFILPWPTLAAAYEQDSATRRHMAQ
jgi:hypothetical protein